MISMTSSLISFEIKDPAFVSLSSSKHKTNTLQNSALHLESQNTNESIEYKPHRTHRKQPMSTKHASMNFINKIYYLGPINIETSQLQAPKSKFLFNSTIMSDPKLHRGIIWRKNPEKVCLYIPIPP